MQELRWTKLETAGHITSIVHGQAVLRGIGSTPRELGGRELYSRREWQACVATTPRLSNRHAHSKSN